MSILTYLQESLLSEKLPIKLAKKFTRQGKKNAEELPSEFKTAYDKMFGDKNRIQIGTVTLPKDDSKHRNLQADLRDLVDFMNKNKNPELPDILSKIKIFGPYPEDPRYIDVQTSDPDIKKELSQAFDPKMNKYLFKTVIKRLKKYILKDKQNQLSQMGGQLLTKGSNISQESTAPVILSKHPYDVAGMSTGKRWQSCKNVVTGCNRHYLDDEVGHLLIAFVANPNAKGKDLLSDPYSRTLVMPVESNDTYGLYVSSDIYGMHIPGFYDTVVEYIKHFMPVFDDDDEKETVGNYYEDSGFNNLEREEEQRWDDFDDAINAIDNKFSSAVPREVTDLISDYYRDQVMDYVLDPEDIHIPERDLIDIDNLFEYMKDLGIDANDYVSTYIDDNIESFLEMMANHTADDIIREYIVFNPHFINNHNQLEYMIDNDLIDSVSDFVHDILAEDGDILDGSVGKAVVDFVSRHEDTEDWSNNDWIRDIDLITMWNDSDLDDIDEFYGFLRMMGLTHKEILESFDNDLDAYDISPNIEQFWDKRLTQTPEEKDAELH